MSRAVILHILLSFSGTLIMAAVLPETTERPSPTPEADVTSMELLLKDLALPAEVISETLFNQVDNLQDLLEQCEGTVSNHLLVDSAKNDDDDKFISAEIDEVLSGHRPGKDTQIPSSHKLSTLNDTQIPHQAAYDATVPGENTTEGAKRSATSEAAALLFPELFGEASNNEAGVTRQAPHELASARRNQAAGSGWNASGVANTPRQTNAETTTEGGGVAHEDGVREGVSTPAPDSAREDRQENSDDDDNSHEHDENGDSYEEDEEDEEEDEDVDYDDEDNNDSDDDDSDDSDSDQLGNQHESVNNETASTQAENDKKPTKPTAIPTEINKLHAPESSSVPAQVERARRSASRDDTRLGLGELRENGRVRRSSFWDDGKTDVLGMPGSWPSEQRRGEIVRRSKRNVAEGADQKRYLPLINRLVDRFNYLTRSLAACRGLLN